MSNRKLGSRGKGSRRWLCVALAVLVSAALLRVATTGRPASAEDQNPAPRILGVESSSIRVLSPSSAEELPAPQRSSRISRASLESPAEDIADPDLDSVRAPARPPVKEQAARKLATGLGKASAGARPNSTSTTVFSLPGQAPRVGPMALPASQPAPVPRNVVGQPEVIPQRLPSAPAPIPSARPEFSENRIAPPEALTEAMAPDAAFPRALSIAPPSPRSRVEPLPPCPEPAVRHEPPAADPVDQSRSAPAPTYAIERPAWPGALDPEPRQPYAWLGREARASPPRGTSPWAAPNRPMDLDEIAATSPAERQQPRTESAARLPAFDAAESPEPAGPLPRIVGTDPVAAPSPTLARVVGESPSRSLQLDIGEQPENPFGRAIATETVVPRRMHEELAPATAAYVAVGDVAAASPSPSDANRPAVDAAKLTAAERRMESAPPTERSAEAEPKEEAVMVAEIPRAPKSEVAAIDDVPPEPDEEPVIVGDLGPEPDDKPVMVGDLGPEPDEQPVMVGDLGPEPDEAAVLVGDIPAPAEPEQSAVMVSDAAAPTRAPWAANRELRLDDLRVIAGRDPRPVPQRLPPSVVGDEAAASLVVRPTQGELPMAEGAAEPTPRRSRLDTASRPAEAVPSVSRR